MARAARPVALKRRIWRARRMRCPACNIALAGCAGDGAVAHSANRRSLELTLRLIGTRAADPLPSEKTVRSAQASLPDPFLLAGASPQDAPGASLLFIGVLQRGRA